MNVISLGLLSVAFQSLWFLGAIAVAVVLVQLYFQTRMASMLWLMVGVVAWPMLARILAVATPLLLPTLAARTGAPILTLAAWLALVTGVETLIGIVLLVIAVLKLKADLGRSFPVAAVLTSPYPATPHPR